MRHRIKLILSLSKDKILAGKVNPRNNMFSGDKDTVTDMVLRTASQFLLYNDESFLFESNGELYVLTVTKPKGLTNENI